MESRDRSLMLDGLRGLAAIAVVVLHFPQYAGGALLPSAYVAVDLFFVLSGYVLAAGKLPAMAAGRLNAGAFIAQRLFRLLPMVAFATVVASSSVAAAIAFDRAQHWTLDQLAVALPPAILGLPAVGDGPVFQSLFPLNVAAWSLFLELIASITLAIGARYVTARRVGAIMMIGAIALICARLTFGTLNVGSTAADWWGGLARMVYAFAAGMLIHLLSDVRPPKMHPAAISALMIALFAGAPSFAGEMTGALIVAPVLVWLSTSAEPSPTLGRLCSKLAAASYPLYLLHIPILRGLDELAAIWSIPPGAGGVPALAGLFGLSLLCHRWIEAPLARYGKRSTSRHLGAGLSLA